MKGNKYIILFVLMFVIVAMFSACSSTAKHESTGEYIDDSAITTKIKFQIAKDDFLKSFQISVESRKGIVQLSGFVDSQNMVDKAGKIAEGVNGVKMVKNDLIVK
jgi:osmotically-inducible protein OsmY